MPSYESEESCIRFLDKIDEEVEAARPDFKKKVDENLNLLRGIQWKGNSSPTFMYNILEESASAKTGKLSETKPEISVLPGRNGLQAEADVLSQVVQSIWDCEKMEFKSERVALWGFVSGVSFVGTPWDAKRQDINIVVKDPRCCGVDISTACPEDADMGEYFVVEDYVPLDIIRDEYPGRGALVKPDDRVNGYDRPKGPMSAGEHIRSAMARLFKGKKPDVLSAIPKGMIREYYIKDRRKSIEDKSYIPITRLTQPCEDGGAPFPGGRWIIRAGDTILKDTYNNYWDECPPCDMMSWKIDLESAWGPDEIQGVKRMQEAVNRLGDAYTKTALINSVVRLIMDEQALSPEERNKLSNTVGEIIVKRPGREVEYMVPELLPADVVLFVEKLMEWIRNKIGVTEVPTKKDVPSIVTGPAIEGLQLMIETPIRSAARRMEEFYQRIGQKLISRVVQYYTADRTMALVGPDSKWIKYEYKRLKILQKPDGSPRSDAELREILKNEFRFVISPQSSLAETKRQRTALIIGLVQMGLLHPEEVLKNAGFLNVKEKMDRAMEAKSKGMFEVISGGKASGPGPIEQAIGGMQ